MTDLAGLDLSTVLAPALGLGASGALLAVRATAMQRQVPVVAENGDIKVGWRMKATVAVDHRVSDGAEGAQFMQALAKYLEEPVRLLV